MRCTEDATLAHQLEKFPISFWLEAPTYLAQKLEIAIIEFAKILAVAHTIGGVYEKAVRSPKPALRQRAINQMSGNIAMAEAGSTWRNADATSTGLFFATHVA